MLASFSLSICWYASHSLLAWVISASFSSFVAYSSYDSGKTSVVVSRLFLLASSIRYYMTFRSKSVSKSVKKSCRNFLNHIFP